MIFSPIKYVYWFKQDNLKNQELTTMDCVYIYCVCFSLHYSFQLCLTSFQISRPLQWPVRSMLPCQTLSHQLSHMVERTSFSLFPGQKAREGPDWPSWSHKAFFEATPVSREIQGLGKPSLGILPTLWLELIGLQHQKEGDDSQRNTKLGGRKA